MLIPDIETDSREDIQAKLDLWSTLDIPHKPNHFHIDVVDGLFADMITVMPGDLYDIDWHGNTFEYHLLVNEPDEYLGEVIGSGAVKVIAQVEHMIDRDNFIATANELKLSVGLALDLPTPIEELTDRDLSSIKSVLLMSVPAGFSGQTFNPLVIPKIKELRSRGFRQEILIDGGVNPTNIPDLVKAGATHFAVNSVLWHDDVTQNLKSLLSAM